MLLLGLWLLLLEPESWSVPMIGLDWTVGAVAAVGAALLSLRLLPPSFQTPRPWPLLRLALRFLTQSVLAGLDVTRRALDPRLPLRPALVHQPTRLPHGMARALFGALTSQVPGTLAVDIDAPGELLYHCLDQHQDVGRSLAADEALFLAVSGAGRSGRRERRE